MTASSVSNLTADSAPKAFKQIQKRSLWIMSLLSILYVASFFYIEYTNISREIEEEKQSARNQIVQALELEMDRLVNFYTTRVKCHFSSPDALYAMENRDRDAIYQSVKPKFDVLKSQTPHLSQVQFLAPDGTSLLRVHNRKLYGDDVSQKRPMVSYAIESQSSIFGFEEGVTGLGFRLIEPVFNREDEYIGSMEFGFEPLYFEQIIKELFPDTKTVMLVASKNLQTYQDNGDYESYKDYFVMGDDLDLIKPFIGSQGGLAAPVDRAVEVGGRSYLLINDLFLEDFMGEPFIQLVTLKDIEALEERFYTKLKESALLGFLLLLVIWTGSYYVLRYFADKASSLSLQLERSHAKMEAVFNSTVEGVALVNTEGLLIDANPALCRLLGYTITQIQHLPLKKVVSQIDESAMCDILRSVLYAGEMVERVECVFLTQSGEEVLLEVSMVGLKGEECALMTCRDITQLRKQKAEILSYVAVVDRYVITSKTDVQGKITYVSDAFSQISGYSKLELIGRDHSIVRHPDMPSSIYRAMWKNLLGGKPWVGEIKNRRKDGSSYWVTAAISPDFDSAGVIVGYTAIRQDITDQKRIEELSITDELTGLYNRRHYNNTFERVFNQRKRDQVPFLFVLMDIDYFKRYNDQYGHQAGDQALESVSKALKNAFQRNGDTLYRLGGEEFGAILHTDSRADVDVLLNRIHKTIAELSITQTYHSPTERLTVSIGACLVKSYSASLSEAVIYKLADKALYQAKERGRNQSVLEVV